MGEGGGGGSQSYPIALILIFKEVVSKQGYLKIRIPSLYFEDGLDYKLASWSRVVELIELALPLLNKNTPDTSNFA